MHNTSPPNSPGHRGILDFRGEGLPFLHIFGEKKAQIFKAWKRTTYGPLRPHGKSKETPPVPPNATEKTQGIRCC